MILFLKRFSMLNMLNCAVQCQWTTHTHTHTHTHTQKIYFILDPHEKHMGLCNQSCSSGWLAGLCLPVRPSVLPGKIFNTGYYMQTFLPIFFFIPAFCLSGCLASQPSYLVKAFVLNITDRLFKFCYTCCAHSYCWPLLFYFLYYFWWPWPWLIVNKKQNLVGSFSCILQSRTRMMYLYCLTCLRYTILVLNPRIVLNWPGWNVIPYETVWTERPVTTLEWKIYNPEK